MDSDKGKPILEKGFSGSDFDTNFEYTKAHSFRGIKTDVFDRMPVRTLLFGIFMTALSIACIVLSGLHSISGSQRLVLIIVGLIMLFPGIYGLVLSMGIYCRCRCIHKQYLPFFEKK